MNKVTRNSGENQYLFDCFLSIKDPRVEGRCVYSLINIVVITLCALISGCDTWEAIELFGKQRKRWLSRYLDLNNSIPSHQTFARVFSLINPKEFQRSLAEWMREITQLLTRDVIAVDGKTSRGSSRSTREEKGIHMVNAYVGRTKSTLASIKLPDKTNEIKAIPTLLKMINPNGCIITTDAMGTQRGIAKLIRKKQAHYVLCLKGNHKRLNKKVRCLFEKSDEVDYKSMLFRHSESHDYGHSRIEERTYTILPSMYLPQYQKEWKDLSAFIRVDSVRHLSNGKIERASHYYITSLPFKENKKMCHAIREHWQVENGLHYRLDVGLNEDSSQITRGHAPENLSIMRKIVLKLLDREKSYQAGVASKRSKAALNTRYLRKVVGF